MNSVFKFGDAAIAMLKPLNEFHLFYDVKLQTNDGKMFNVHRIILAMHSRPFALLFEGNYNRKLPFDIHTGTEQMSFLIKLLYGGQVTVGEVHRQEFLEMLEEYEINNCTEIVNHVDQDTIDFDEFVPQMESTNAYGDDDNNESSDSNDEIDAANVVVGSDVSAAESDGESEADDDEAGAATATDQLDKTIPTSAEEIVENLFLISDVRQETVKQKKYSLRYWMAVIMARWPKLSERDIADKFSISRSTIKKHLLKSPRECMYNPHIKTKTQCPPCTAEQIVEYLSKPDKKLISNEETYSLRFWLSVVVLKWQKIERTQLQLAKLFEGRKPAPRRSCHGGFRYLTSVKQALDFCLPDDCQMKHRQFSAVWQAEVQLKLEC